MRLVFVYSAPYTQAIELMLYKKKSHHSYIQLPICVTPNTWIFLFSLTYSPVLPVQL